jgi:hypothetical protein
MKKTSQPSLPTSIRPQAEAILEVTNAFCDRLLDAEYKALCKKLVERLARKRPSPLARGEANIWAGAVVYVVGRQNFLFDSAQKPHLTPDHIGEGVGVPKKTISNKAGLICRILGITRMTYDYHRKDMLARDPLVWMIEVNGFLMDARQAPPDVQTELRRRGIIPDVDPVTDAGETKELVGLPPPSGLLEASAGIQIDDAAVVPDVKRRAGLDGEGAGGAGGPAHGSQ